MYRLCDDVGLKILTNIYYNISIVFIEILINHEKA